MLTYTGSKQYLTIIHFQGVLITKYSKLCKPSKVYRTLIENTNCKMS